MKKIALTATLTAAVIGTAAAAAFGGMTTAMPFAEQSEIYAVTSYATADANDSNSDMQDTAPVPLLIVTGEGQYIAEADGGAFYANIRHFRHTAKRRSSAARHSPRAEDRRAHIASSSLAI